MKHTWHTSHSDLPSDLLSAQITKAPLQNNYENAHPCTIQITLSWASFWRTLRLHISFRFVDVDDINAHLETVACFPSLCFHRMFVNPVNTLPLAAATLSEDPCEQLFAHNLSTLMSRHFCTIIYCITSHLQHGPAFRNLQEVRHDAFKTC